MSLNETIREALACTFRIVDVYKYMHRDNTYLDSILYIAF